MRTLLETDGGALKVSESYGTVKNRLHTAADFIEVTGEKGKITLNKQVINTISPIEKKKK